MPLEIAIISHRKRNWQSLGTMISKDTVTLVFYSEDTVTLVFYSEDSVTLVFYS